MNYIIRECSVCANRIVVLITNRSFVSTPACLVRGKFGWSPLRNSVPRVNEKLRDWDFEGTEPDFADYNENVEQLESEYGREIREERGKLWKILTKKKMENLSKAPNMLTQSEREHLKYLHNSDPEYWTPERLSESFPALPYVIKKILKNKWSMENAEDKKNHDAKVLENWEKLKRNQLQAEPAVLNHLKKFINRRNTLRLQMDNPKFFPEPTIPKKLTWNEGPLTKLLTKYEREIKRIRDSSTGETGLVPTDGGGKVVEKNEKRQSVIEKIKMMTEGKDIKEDSFLIGKYKREQEVTLEDMKQNILEKMNKKSQLSKFEEFIMDKTLSGGRRDEEKAQMENESQSVKHVSLESGEKNVKTVNQQQLLDSILKETPKDSVEEQRTVRVPNLKNSDHTDKDLRQDQTRSLSEMNVGQFLYPSTVEDNVGKDGEKKAREIKKTSFECYATEKDKEMVERDVELLKNSAFWTSNNKQRNKSKDAQSIEYLSTNTSPHISPTMRTYYTYDYPDRVDIPAEKWKKGMTYRVKDCYYDDDGEFLFRVPGVEMD